MYCEKLYFAQYKFDTSIKAFKTYRIFLKFMATRYAKVAINVIIKNSIG